MGDHRVWYLQAAMHYPFLKYYFTIDTKRNIWILGFLVFSWFPSFPNFVFIQTYCKRLFGRKQFRHLLCGINNSFFTESEALLVGNNNFRRMGIIY